MHTSTLIIYVVLYVDDIIITSNNSNALFSFIQKLDAHFSIKDLRNLHYILGIEIQRSPTGLFPSQHKYIMDLLEHANMSNAKPTAIPLSTSSLTTGTADQLIEDVKTYRTMVGKLQYLHFTRLDIAFAINKLSQHTANPTLYHWQSLKRLLCYLVGIANHRNTPNISSWLL